jgi:hypothetical protein
MKKQEVLGRINHLLSSILYHPLLFSCYRGSGSITKAMKGGVQTKQRTMRNNIYKQSTQQKLPTSTENIHNKETPVKQVTNQNPLYRSVRGLAARGQKPKHRSAQNNNTLPLRRPHSDRTTLIEPGTENKAQTILEKARPKPNLATSLDAIRNSSEF